MPRNAPTVMELELSSNGARELQSDAHALQLLLDGCRIAARDRVGEVERLDLVGECRVP